MKLATLLFFGIVVVSNFAARAQYTSKFEGLDLGSRESFVSNTKQLFAKTGKFIENVGQYDSGWSRSANLGLIKFGFEGFDMPVYFTSKGVIHLHQKIYKKSNDRQIVNNTVTMEWIGSNPNVELISEGVSAEYYTYGFIQAKARGFEKLIYKNLYPNIDLIYHIPKNKPTGFEYKLIIKPGGNVSDIRMKYGGDVKNILIDQEGVLKIHSQVNGISETAPIAFAFDQKDDYENTKDYPRVACSSALVDQVVYFNVSAYDKKRTLVIDPFITNTLNLTGAIAGVAKDVDFDFDGNIYVTGGEGPSLPCKVAKFDNTGTLLWTFNGTIGSILWNYGTEFGAMAVERTTGKVYLGQGFVGFPNGSQIIRLGTDGLYDNFITPMETTFSEHWKIAWDCNSGITRLLIGGGSPQSNKSLGVCVPPSTTVNSTTLTGLAGWSDDVADLILDPVSNDMFTIYASRAGTPFVNDRIFKHMSPYSAATISWHTASGFDILQEQNNRPYLPPDVSNLTDNSINGLAQNDLYLFYWDGLNLKAFNKSDGSAAGTALTIAGNVALMQGGIATDGCNNVYIGSINGTIKSYTFNGSSFNDTALPDLMVNGYATSSVYDLVYDKGKALLYASGNGFVASFDVSSNCPNPVYAMSIASNCTSLTAQASLNPIPTVVTYTLFNAAGQVTSNTSGLFTGLVAGTSYTIKAFVNDICGGIQTTGAFTLNNCPLSIATTFTHPACAAATNGSITAVGVNGAGPYQYSLNGGTFQPNGIFPGLSAGLHIVTVKDALNNIFDTTITLTNTSTLQVSATASPTTCNSSNGLITATASGGLIPYLFSVDGTNFQTSNEFISLSPNIYTLTVKDANNCTNTFAITVASITPPQVTAIANNATCNSNNGVITAAATNGSTPYLFSIDGVNFQGGNTFNSVAPNNYTVTVKDADNCTSTFQLNVPFTSAPQLTVVPTPTGCNNNTGAIVASGSGGLAPYQYNINGGTFQLSNTFSGLAGNNYLVSITDANQCSASVNVFVDQTNNIILNAGSASSICEGESTQIPMSSDAASFSWTPITGLNNPYVLNPHASPAVTTIYTVTATTGTCSKTESITVTVNSAPIANAGRDSTICLGKDIQLFGTGGISYSWAPETYLNDAAINNPIVSIPISGVVTYALSVVDLNGCKSLNSDFVNISVTPPPVLFIGNDTSIAINQPIQLQVVDLNNTGLADFEWIPSYGLNNPHSSHPVAILDRDMIYKINAATPSGCAASGDIEIKVHRGPEIYVPSAFSPNNDGTNDLLKAVPIGMKALSQFTIFNKYGQMIFSSKNSNEGWDGKYKNYPQQTGTYIWFASALDPQGRVITKKGYVVLIR